MRNSPPPGSVVPDGISYNRSSLFNLEKFASPQFLTSLIFKHRCYMSPHTRWNIWSDRFCDANGILNLRSFDTRAEMAMVTKKMMRQCFRDQRKRAPHDIVKDRLGFALASIHHRSTGSASNKNDTLNKKLYAQRYQLVSSDGLKPFTMCFEFWEQKEGGKISGTSSIHNFREFSLWSAIPFLVRKSIACPLPSIVSKSKCMNSTPIPFPTAGHVTHMTKQSPASSAIETSIKYFQKQQEMGEYDKKKKWVGKTPSKKEMGEYENLLETWTAAFVDNMDSVTEGALTAGRNAVKLPMFSNVAIGSTPKEMAKNTEYLRQTYTLWCAVFSLFRIISVNSIQEERHELLRILDKYGAQSLNYFQDGTRVPNERYFVWEIIDCFIRPKLFNPASVKAQV